MTDCNICCSKFNKREHKMVCCPYCNENACSKCVSSFLLTIPDYHCMYDNCKKQWTKEMLFSSLPKTFINTTLRSHREKILLEQQIALLPATQPRAEVEKFNKNVDEKHKEINKMVRELSRNYKEASEKICEKIKTSLIRVKSKAEKYDKECKRLMKMKLTLQLTQITAYNEQKVEIKKLIKNNKEKIKKIYDDEKEYSDNLRKDDANLTFEYEKEKSRLNKIKNNYNYNNMDIDEEIILEKKSVEKRQFIKNCPNNDCRGFLSTQWICKLCGIKACKECHEIIEIKDKEKNTHKCNEHTIETIKSIKTNTKPCPTCGINIFKIDGCDQMWCVECKTAFSWKSGKIETGVIHNPHFLQFQRINGGNIPRNPLDVLCGGIPDNIHFNGHYQEVNRNEDIIVSIRYCVTHNTWETQNPRDFNHGFMHIRIKYLINKIDLKKFSSEIYLLHKDEETYSRVRELKQMFVHSITDIFQRYNESFEKNKKIFMIEYGFGIIINENIELYRNIHDLFYKETNALREYYNTQIKNINNCYKSDYSFINDTWVYEDVYKYKAPKRVVKEITQNEDFLFKI